MFKQLLTASFVLAALTLPLGLFLMTGCGVMSSVEFTQPAATKLSAPVQAVGATAGGVSRVTTANGYVAGSSFGAPTGKVTGQTVGGYTVQLNIQGQLAQ